MSIDSLWRFNEERFSFSRRVRAFQAKATLPGKCRRRLRGACFIGHERVYDADSYIRHLIPPFARVLTLISYPFRGSIWRRPRDRPPCHFQIDEPLCAADAPQFSRTLELSPPLKPTTCRGVIRARGLASTFSSMLTGVDWNCTRGWERGLHSAKPWKSMFLIRASAKHRQIIRF
jgi:hypothetical protein